MRLSLLAGTGRRRGGKKGRSAGDGDGPAEEEGGFAAAAAAAMAAATQVPPGRLGRTGLAPRRDDSEIRLGETTRIDDSDRRPMTRIKDPDG